MNREFLTELISKDLQELRMLVDGFLAQPNQPRPIVELAAQKAHLIADNLMQLLDKEETIVSVADKINFKPEDTMPYEQPTTIADRTDITSDTPSTPVEEELVEGLQEPIVATTTDSVEEEIPLQDHELLDTHIEPLPTEVHEEEPATPYASTVEELITTPNEPTSTAADETPVDETPVDETPVDETPVDETPDELARGEELDLFSSMGLEVTPAPQTAEHKPVGHSIFDTIKNENTVASVFQNKKIDNLKQSFSIADRFLFQRELFDGSGEKFMNAIENIDNMVSLDQVEQYVHTNYPKWLDNNDIAKEFLTIVARKFC